MEQLYLDALIADDIREKIAEGIYREQERLPSEQQLCEMYHVQKMTIRASLQILKDEGILVSVHRSGYYVRPPRVRRDLRSFREALDPICGEGCAGESRIVQLEMRQADALLSRKSGMKPGTWVYFMECLERINGTVAAVVQSSVLAEPLPGLTREEFSEGPLDALLAKRGQIYLDRAEMELSAAYSDTHRAELLSVEAGSPLVLERGLFYDRSGRVVVCSERYYPMDRFQFVG